MISQTRSARIQLGSSMPATGAAVSRDHHQPSSKGALPDALRGESSNLRTFIGWIQMYYEGIKERRSEGTKERRNGGQIAYLSDRLPCQQTCNGDVGPSAPRRWVSVRRAAVAEWRGAVGSVRRHRPRLASRVSRRDRTERARLLACLDRGRAAQ